MLVVACLHARGIDSRGGWHILSVRGFHGNANLRPSMDDDKHFDLTMLAAGWRVLCRHVRYAGASPANLLGILRRGTRIVQSGELLGVLQRHRVAGRGLHRDYAAWLAAQAPRFAARRAQLTVQVAAQASPPRFSILLPVVEPAGAFVTQAIDSVRAQTYPHWELCIAASDSTSFPWRATATALAAGDARIRVANGPGRVRREGPGDVRDEGFAGRANSAMAIAGGEFVLILRPQDCLEPDALLEFAARAIAQPAADVMYCDHDRIGANGTLESPFFKPDFDSEWVNTTDCASRPLVLRRSRLQELQGWSADAEGLEDFELLQRLVEIVPRANVAHVARVLYHWRECAADGGGEARATERERTKLRIVDAALSRRSVGARAETGEHGLRIRYPLPEPLPSVTIVVPVRDRADLLRRCVDGLRNRTQYDNWQVVLVDNGTRDRDALAIIDGLRPDARFTVLRDDRPFNYAALCNAGVASARGEIVVLLNNDIEPVNADWLRELVSHALRPEIGMVGAMLYYPDMTIQHAGVVLWLNGVADRPYIGYPRGFPGIDNRLSSVHTVSAMITACAAMRTTVYREAGGMDESLAIACNDVDLCLRVAAMGLTNIVTPYAELIHRESASRGYRHHSPESLQMRADEARFRDKWWKSIPRDPTYNANLALRGTAFMLSPTPGRD